MAYHYEKETGDLVIDGWDKGIQPSPVKGIASIRNANISTESGEVMANYARSSALQPNIVNGTFLPDNTSILLYTGTPVLQVGATVQVTASTITGLSLGYYWVTAVVAGNQISLSSTNPQNSTNVTGLGNTGSATFTTILPAVSAVQGCIEQYYDASNVTQSRSYILFKDGTVWCNDTGLTVFGVNPGWFLTTSPGSASIAPNNNAGGIGVLNGFLHVAVDSLIYTQFTSTLGFLNNRNQGWNTLSAGVLNTSYGSPNSHFMFSFTGLLYICDSNFVASIFPNSNTGAGQAANPNLASWGVYTFSGSTLTISNLIGGDIPVIGNTITFLTSGTLPTGVTVNTVYYIRSVTVGTSFTTITVAASVGGGAISLSGGSGTQFFDTYNTQVALTYIFQPQALLLGNNEITQRLSFLGIQLIVGCKSNSLYTWTVGSQPGTANNNPDSRLELQETDCRFLQNSNNQIYIGTGQKGNVYVFNGQTAGTTITVPDYMSGTPGTPSSYIEPYFTFGSACNIRGRVFFTIQDSNGNCGGTYSFIPVQNIVIGQDVGLAMRLETFNSYGTYAGLANVILPLVNQQTNGPQYWTAWTEGNGAFSIDGSSTLPYTGGQTVIETDAIPTGTVLGEQKKTFSNIEIKLATPLATGESVAVNYRQNITDAWATAGVATNEPTNPQSVIISPLAFQNTQWLQLQVVLTSTATNPSFVRVTEIRVRTT